MGLKDRDLKTTADTDTVKLAAAENLLKQAAAYVANAQPQLDRHAEFTDRFEKRAQQVTGVLIDRGIIPASQSATLLHKFAADPVVALDMITKLARLVGPDQLGKSAGAQATRGRELDPFEALVLHGDPSNTSPGSPAMVD